jgi:hypothetical protein
MNEVLSAYHRLLDIASRGETYSVDRVLNPPYPGDAQADTVFGTGFDIDHTMTVSDIVDGKTVEATAKLRVIKTAANELYLRTWLIWTPSDGHEHKSYASYEFGCEAAEQLAVHQPSTTDEQTEDDLLTMSLSEVMESVLSLAFTCLDEVAPYKAHWQQFVPGEDLDLDNEDDYDFAERHYNYHEKVIVGLNGTESPATCMLSSMELGEVGPQEIVVLAGYVADRLDVSALV